ncbi:MAG: glycosyltransferase family 4 protein [Lachnospiraceae bacterium]|nr:glycosyltransferase family 4 protein [Lachnospiraceae bacterium]
MTKVCFFSGDITRNGGTERVAITLANELSRDVNFEISFLSLTESGEAPFFDIAPRIKKAYLSDKWINPGPGYLKIMGRLKKYLDKNKPDVIVDIDIVLDVLSVPVAKKMGIRVISWQHFSYMYEFSVTYRRIILKLFTKRADKFVTLTRKGAEVMAKYLSKRDVLVIPNPMPEVTDIPPYGAKKKQLITIGHLIPIKGIEYIKEISLRLFPMHSDWRWLIIGDGEKEQELREFAETNGIAESLVIIGKAEDVGAYYRESAVYVMTSKTEGLPMTLLEAKAYSLPSVAFDIATGPSDIILDGINGYLIEPFDTEDMINKLTRLMEEEGLREDMSAHAYDNGDEFKLKNIVDRWKECFA